MLNKYKSLWKRKRKERKSRFINSKCIDLYSPKKPCHVENSEVTVILSWISNKFIFLNIETELVDLENC